MSENTKKSHTVSNEELSRQKQFTQKVSSVISASYDEKPKACVITYGCQQNVADSEKIKGMLEIMGYDFTDDRLEAKLIIFNTCAVREHAEDRVFGNVGALKSYKQKNHDVVIALCGCMMQQQHIADKIKKSYPFVDLVFGTHVVHKLPELLYKALTGKKRVFDIDDTDQVIAEGIPVKRDNDAKAWLPIMYGCNNFCSYCIVPYVRGRERSREKADIIAEFKCLVEQGYKEITLLGQNVNSYGKTLEHPISFAQLLRQVEQIEGLERIRFMTSHPKDLSDDLIQAMADCEKVCSHLHLPLQSGSSRILKKMNRHYTKEDYLLLVKKIREKLPEIALTTDIIVGFPGETEEDFEETLDVVSKVRYDSAYTFIYSKRSGTPAASMEDQVPEDVVKERFAKLLKVVQTISAERTNEKLGMTEPVLIEQVNEQDESLVTGRLSNNAVVHLPGDASMIGSIVPVLLKESKGFYYMGQRV